MTLLLTACNKSVISIALLPCPRFSTEAELTTRKSKSISDQKALLEFSRTRGICMKIEDDSDFMIAHRDVDSILSRYTERSNHVIEALTRFRVRPSAARYSDQQRMDQGLRQQNPARAAGDLPPTSGIWAIARTIDRVSAGGGKTPRSTKCRYWSLGLNPSPRL